MEVLKPYDQLFKTDKQYIFMKSGRSAGKSTAGGGQFPFYKFFKEDGDMIMCRASTSDLQASLMAEIMSVINAEGLGDAVETRTRPLKIINKLNGNKIYFKGIGGADIHRTKGFKPDKKLSLIIVDELQQVERQANLDEAMDTFLRHLKPNGKIVYMFNPQRRASHWVNEFFRLSKHNDDYLTIETDYRNIAQKLNKHSLARILNEKDINPTEYRFRYLGETEGLFGAVYASFDRDSHLIPHDWLKKYVEKIGIASVIVGADPAATRDATALVPSLILKSGQIVVADYFYHDPKRNGNVTNDSITPYIQTWLTEVMEEWGIKRNNRVTMIFDTNAVSQDLMNTLDYRLPPNFQTMVYPGKKIIEMADVMRSAFSRNMILIADKGYYKNYITGKKMYGVNPLVTQLEQVIWNEAGDGFDRNVPNDMTDALTYSTVFYLKNKGNLYLPQPSRFYKPLELEEEEQEGDNGR